MRNAEVAPDSFRTPSRSAPSIHRRHPSHRPTVGKVPRGTCRELESAGMLCRNGDAVSERHQGQTANLACWRELHCDRKSGLFAAQIGDGNHLRHDRAKESGSSRPVARGPEKVSSANSSTNSVATGHVTPVVVAADQDESH